MADITGRAPSGNQVPLLVDEQGRLLLSPSSVTLLLQSPMAPTFDFPIQFTNGHFLWMDESDNTRVKASAPANATDGTIVTP